jgi:glutamine synthetase
MSKLRAEWNNNKSLEFMQIRYTDVLGKFLARYLSMPADIEQFFRHGIGLDGSSVRGFAHIDDSDLLLLPDRTTVRMVPVSKERMIGTVIAMCIKAFHSAGWIPTLDMQVRGCKSILKVRICSVSLDQKLNALF